MHITTWQSVTCFAARRFASTCTLYSISSRFCVSYRQCFCSFLQSLQNATWILHRLDHHPFLPNPYQSITDESLRFRWHVYRRQINHSKKTAFTRSFLVLQAYTLFYHWLHFSQFPFWKQKNEKIGMSLPCLVYLSVSMSRCEFVCSFIGTFADIHGTWYKIQSKIIILNPCNQ